MTENVDASFWTKESKRLEKMQVENDLLTINIDFDNAETLQHVQIEKNGYFSYRLIPIHKFVYCTSDIPTSSMVTTAFLEVERSHNLILEIQSMGN